MAFGPWIRTERERAGVSLNDFARRLAISPAYWSRIERGLEKAPRSELVTAAATKLGLDTDRAFIEARRLPPEAESDLATVLRVYRSFKSAGR
jgi:transcriptional regulator with XRE-family HTH domain